MPFIVYSRGLFAPIGGEGGFCKATVLGWIFLGWSVVIVVSYIKDMGNIAAETGKRR